MTKRKDPLELGQKIYQEMLALYKNFIIENEIDDSNDLLILICCNFLNELQLEMGGIRSNRKENRRAFKRTVNLMLKEVLQEGKEPVFFDEILQEIKQGEPK